MQAGMVMAIDEAWMHDAAMGVDAARRGPVLLDEACRPDRHDAVAADRNGAIGQDLALAVHGQHATRDNQEIAVLWGHRRQVPILPVSRSNAPCRRLLFSLSR